ncbi:nicotinate-nucleotide-dimethylbenzimidazole phosphoribosyltransferase [Cutibacterium acnes JCM 18920]|nr:nicotinate-nucleotide-dimethylbenzimidazole phosphoribosyltransferase [Cutibacterium acnes JCM 18920]
MLIDGVIACSAALTATAICPEARDFIIASHAGAEPGITASTSALGLPALLDLGMRLGEGSGAILTLPIVQASAHILNEMATFEDAEVIDIKVSGETEIPDTVETSVPPCRMLVIGGARSGKSTFAESRLPRDSRVTYVATSQRNPGDTEWEERIRLHQARRPATCRLSRPPTSLQCCWPTTTPRYWWIALGCGSLGFLTRLAPGLPLLVTKPGRTT